MGVPVAFQTAQQIQGNLGQAFAQKREQNTIEDILSESLSSDDPKVLQNNIGKILSQVSPERQGMAVQYLQHLHAGIKEKQQEARTLAAEQAAGVTPGLAPALQVQQMKNKARQEGLAQYGVGVPQPNTGVGTAKPGQPGMPPKNAPVSLSEISDEELVNRTGAPYKEVSEPAKAELNRRQKATEVSQKKEEGKIKRHTDLSQKVLESSNEIAETLPQLESALGLMENAIANKDLSFWSKDNLAELTGIEGLRSPEGAIFKTAAKEFFLGSIARAGARPNQWIEQQISDMMTKIGRSPEANLSVSRALRNELDLKKERVRLTEEISNDLENSLGYIPRDLGNRVNKELAFYADKKQTELFNDLRAIKSIAEKKPQKFMKVQEGTPISKLVAQSLLRQHDNDPKKAREEAVKLGYTF